MSDWMAVLKAEHKKAKSLKVIANRLNYSTTVISQVLNGVYPGDLDQVKARVEKVFMANQTIICPVLDEISAEECLKHQAAPFSSNNSWKVRLFQACRNGCRHSNIARDGQ